MITIFQYLLACIAACLISFVIGRVSVLDKYRDATEGLQIIASYDRRAAAWLAARQAELAPPPPRRQRPSAEEHIQYFQATSAFFWDALRARRAMRRPSDRDLTDGEIRERSAPRVAHLEESQRDRVLVGAGAR